MSATARLPELYDFSAVVGVVGVEAFLHGRLLGCEDREKYVSRDCVSLAHDTIGADLDLKHLRRATPEVARHGRQQLWQQLHKISHPKAPASTRGSGTQAGNFRNVNGLHGGVRA